MFPEQLHGLPDFLIASLSAAGIVCLLEAFQGNSRNKVFDPQQLLTEVPVNQRAVGERQKFAVRVHFTQTQQIRLAHQRLAAGVDIHINSQLLALPDDGVHGFQAQVQLTAVFRGPAAGAVEIAGGGGVKENGPRHIAAFPLLDLVLDGASPKAGVNEKILEECFADLGIQLVKPQNQLVPVAFFLNGLADGRALSCVPSVRGKTVHQIHQLGNIFFRVAFDVMKRLLEGK